MSGRVPCAHTEKHHFWGGNHKNATVHSYLAIWKGDINAPRLGCTPCVLSLGSESHWWLNMGYAASCLFSCTIFPLRGKMVRGDLEGGPGAYIGT